LKRQKPPHSAYAAALLAGTDQHQFDGAAHTPSAKGGSQTCGAAAKPSAEKASQTSAEGAEGDRGKAANPGAKPSKGGDEKPRSDGFATRVNPAHVAAQWANRDRLPMWIIYNTTTKDFPGKWVARMHLTLPKHEYTSIVTTAATLDDIRALLPPGLHCIGRDPSDDAVIEEVWI
jgi:hypothetical protein